MTTTTRTTKAGSITRTLTIGFAIAGKALVQVCETTQLGKTTTDNYTLERQSSDFGIAFRVKKDDADEAYDVCLNMPGGGHSCDCKWGTYKSHVKPCRHVEMCLQALRERVF